MSDRAIKDAIQAWKSSRPVVLYDNLRHVGLCAIPSVNVDAHAVNFLLTECRGSLYVILPADRLRALQIPEHARTEHGAYRQYVPVDARAGITTGVSAADRAATIKALLDPNCRGDAFVQPGHLTPLAALEGGVSARLGPAEALQTLSRMAGCGDSVTVAATLNKAGAPSNRAELESFAACHRAPLVSIASVVRSYRRMHGWPTSSNDDATKHLDLPLRGVQAVARFRGGHVTRPLMPVMVHRLCLSHHVLRVDGRCGSDLAPDLDALAVAAYGAVVTWWRPADPPLRCDKETAPFEEGLREVIAADLVAGVPTKNW